MGQRTSRSAHYNKGIWKKRNARYYGPDQVRANPKPRKPKGSDHLPRPKIYGWTKEMWRDAHTVRFGCDHHQHCRCTSHESGLWRHLTSKGFL